MEHFVKFTLLGVMLFTIVAAISCKKAPKAGEGASSEKTIIENTQDDSLAALKKRGTFVLGLDDSFPPMGYRDDNNEIVGFDIDLAKEVASRLGVSFKAQPISWDAKELELSTGKIDCIWNGFTITDERKESLCMSDAYLNNAQVLIVRADSKIKTLKDAKGLTVGVQKGSSAQEAIDSNKDFASSLKDIVFYQENITALNDLELGGIDAVVMDSVVAEYDIAMSKKPLKVLTDVLANEEYGIGFRKSDAQLRDAVQGALSAMQADGTVEKISTKWFGSNISVIK